MDVDAENEQPYYVPSWRQHTLHGSSDNDGGESVRRGRIADRQLILECLILI